MNENSHAGRPCAEVTFLSAVRRMLPSPLGPGRILRGMDRLERATALDKPIEVLRSEIRGLPLGPWRDALHGRWLGHPLHPVLAHAPLGTWLSAAVLDCLPGQQRAAHTLIGVGIAAAAPAALSGWADWAEQSPRQQRVGLAHATVNIAAVVLYGTSFVARLRGRTARGRVLGFAGLSAVGIGGAIGGHMAYRQASGANHAEAVTNRVTPGWHTIGVLSDFTPDQPARRLIDGVPVVVVRGTGDDVHVLADSCSHMGGPLSAGTTVDGCVRCPWHGSVFRLTDGWNIGGPATAPQPAFETRLVDNHVEARLRDPAPRGGTLHEAARQEEART